MIQTKTSKITSFGGIYVVHQKISKSGLIRMIDSGLGKRSKNAQYSYRDLLLNMLYICLCGGDCAEDLNYLRESFSLLRGLKLPSADVMLKMQKELSTPAEEIITETGEKNKININEKLNSFLLEVATYLGVLKNREAYCLDFDQQLIPTEKYDSKRSYKKVRGYFPAVASINRLPVYIENRNGNCNVKFEQLSTLQRVFKNLDVFGIKVAHVRMDCGSYIKEVCEFIDRRGIKFYIRAEQSATLLRKASQVKEWSNIRIGFQDYEASSFEYRFGMRNFRIVAYRLKNNTGQINLLTGDSYKYWFLITNNTAWSEKEVIEFYNDRGDAERTFDIQNNDFNWRKLPFSFLEQNTVYLVLMAICNVIYQWLLKDISKAVDFLPACSRLKRFTFRFICIAGKLVYRGRREEFTLYTKHNLAALINDS